MSIRPNSRSRIALIVCAMALAVGSPLPEIQGAAAAPTATIAKIEPTRVADLVMLNDGFNAGLRQGMICRVTRQGLEVGDVLIVDIRPAASAALILGVVNKQALRAGDVVTVKVLKT